MESSTSSATRSRASADRRRADRSGDPRKRDSRKRRVRLGKTTPRIYTPPAVTGPPGPCGCGCALSPTTSLGFSVVRFADGIARRPLLPWQRWLLIHALELSPDGSLRFRNVVVLVARQNGKSTLSQVLALWAMYVLGRRVVLGTAQDLDTAEEVWQGAVDMVEETDDDERPVRPELFQLYAKTDRVNGKKALVLKSGQRYKVKAANRKAGRGLSGDLIFLDELREHQNWDAWAAITKTMMARPHGQVWCLSNAGDITSVVLSYLRKLAHRAVGDPDGICAEDETLSAPTEFDVESLAEDDADELGEIDLDDLMVEEADLFLAEWSSTPGCDKRDRDEWAQANPSMNHDMGDGAGLTERAIASAAATDPEWVFRTEVLCQWPEGAIHGPWAPGSWLATTNQPRETPGGEKYVDEADRIVGDVCAAVSVSRDRSRAHIAFAGRRPDGLRQVEVVASRQGTDWVKPWLMDGKRRGRIESITGQSRGAQESDLLKALAEDKEFTIPVVTLAGTDLPAAYGQAFDALRDGEVRHNPQPLVDMPAASAATKDLGQVWVIDDKASPVDAAPLNAWVFALWLLSRPAKHTPPPPPPPRAVKSTTTDTTTPKRSRVSADVNFGSVGF